MSKRSTNSKQQPQIWTVETLLSEDDYFCSVCKREIEAEAMATFKKSPNRCRSEVIDMRHPKCSSEK